MSLILGSQSPRRKEILNYFHLPFSQVSSSFDESSVPFEGDPISYVSKLSQSKAFNLIPQYPNATILTADTIVYREGSVYNKPRDEEDAFLTLKSLCAQWHQVFTCVSIYYGGHIESLVEETRVLLNDLSDEEIRKYHQSINFLDKAGAYAIQGTGCLLCKKIDGCYYNVMGLPINAVRKLLTKSGINIWDALGKNSS